MSDTSSILSLPYLQPSQAQKHVTHNEALTQLDVLVQLVVESVDALVPPAVPVEGETHALGFGASGAWAGHDEEIASFADGAWHFVALKEGWRAWAKDRQEVLSWSAGAWVQTGGQPQNLDGVGIKTTSDSTNRLAIQSPATLLSHEGAGHQLKVNKATLADTASLLFQTGFSGRAEMGLTGNDDFSVKVSPDGTAWTDAFTVDAATGYIGIGSQTPPSPLTIVKSAPDAPISIRLQNWSGNASKIAADRGLVFSADHDNNSGNTQSFISFEVDANEHMQIPANGIVAIGRSGPDVALHVKDILRLEPRSAEPVSPLQGTVYFDSSTAKLRCYDGSAWQNLF